ncbi:MAG: putative molybdenum carrier protein [Planctomycetota bacterium]
MSVRKVVSGGQTGVDRAALDAAAALGLERGGWCPRGRRAEDGAIATSYPLRETPLADYAQRTEWNVRDSDGTLILVAREPLSGGTLLTRELAIRLGRPVLVVELDGPPPTENVRAWLADKETLNVAGPRESGCPGIWARARAFLEALLGGSG